MHPSELEPPLDLCFTIDANLATVNDAGRHGSVHSWLNIDFWIQMYILMLISGSVYE